MTLFRNDFLSALAVLVKLATVLFLKKVLVTYVGTTGYGLVGQYQSVASRATTFASDATNSGVTKYTEEYAADPARQRTVWTTVATLGYWANWSLVVR